MTEVQLLIGDRDAAATSAATFVRQNPISGEVATRAAAAGADDAILAAEAAAEAEPDPVQRQTLMQKVTHMNVVQRLTLALKGGKTERMLLIKDPNKLVQRCVLQSPRLTDSEVEAFSSMTNLTGEILRQIALTRLFIIPELLGLPIPLE